MVGRCRVDGRNKITPLSDHRKATLESISESREHSEEIDTRIVRVRGSAESGGLLVESTHDCLRYEPDRYQYKIG